MIAGQRISADAVYEPRDDNELEFVTIFLSSVSTTIVSVHDFMRRVTKPVNIVSSWFMVSSGILGIRPHRMWLEMKTR